MKIDCAGCEMFRSQHCGDCLVTFLVRAPDESVEIADELGEPLGALAGAGLVPVLKFRPRERGDGVGRARAKEAKGA